MRAHHELILGGQKSGKTVRAEQLAAQWLAADAAHRALYLATARPWDAEMQTRILRHQQERARRVPGMETLQMPAGSRSLPVAELLQQHAAPGLINLFGIESPGLTSCLAVAEQVAQLAQATVAAA